MDRDHLVVLAPFVAAAIVLAIGVVRVTPELEAARGTDRLLVWGPLLVALPMVIFGTQHFGFPDAVASQIPRWIPWHPFWVYVVGTCLVAGALAIALRQRMLLALALFGTMMLLFVLLMHIPRIILAPGDRLSWTVAARDASFGAGGLCLYAARTSDGWLPAKPVMLVGRFLLGGTMILFGGESALFPDYRPGVPTNLTMPGWMPWHVPIALASGLLLVLGGVALLGRVRVRSAAVSLALLFLGLALVLGLPIVIVRPLAIGTGLNYLGDLLLMAGSLLCFGSAAATPTAPRP